MHTGLDRYYTPDDVALHAMQMCKPSKAPTICVDSTCGTGRLLDAASNVFQGVQCVGFDRDREAIALLRKRRPDWILSTGDLLSNRSYRTSRVANNKGVDLLALNPPFSQTEKKSIEIEFDGQVIKSSIAMAYLLRSLTLFKPMCGAVAILPESLLYSEIDSQARSILANTYSSSLIADLKATTFHGARARASIVRYVPGRALIRTIAKKAKAQEHKFPVRLLRGHLPMHLAARHRFGIPLLHTTDLREIVARGTHSHAKFENRSSKLLCGWSVLVPRVGCPTLELIRAVHMASPVQLSDCVIALQCRTRDDARSLAKLIAADWLNFQGMYKGTGARYVTVSKLRDWLHANGILEEQDFGELLK